MHMTSIKKCTKAEGINYLIPAIRELKILGIPHEIVGNKLIVDIPKYLPCDPKDLPEL